MTHPEMEQPEMEHATTPDEPLHDHFADDDDLYAEPLPPRPRRRVFTPARAVLGGVVLVAAGFIGGVLVQKGQGGTAPAGGAGPGGAGGAAAFAARAGQGAAGGGAGGAAGQAGAAPTTGTVANVKGSTLYVTGSDGTTVKVRVDKNAKVTRSAASTAGAVHPGDTVVIQGSTASSGTVTATSVTATAKGVSVASPFGGGGGAAAGGRPAGAGATGGGSASGVPPGFTPPGG
jgi:hypothetical protein